MDDRGDRSLTNSQKHVREFSGQHHAVLSLVVELKTLEEVLVASLVLVGFELTVDRKEFLEGHRLLAALLGTAHLLNRAVRRVEVEGAQDVAEIDGVDDVRAVRIIDGECEFAP